MLCLVNYKVYLVTRILNLHQEGAMLYQLQIAVVSVKENVMPNINISEISKRPYYLHRSSMHQSIQ